MTFIFINTSCGSCRQSVDYRNEIIPRLSVPSIPARDELEAHFDNAASLPTGSPATRRRSHYVCGRNTESVRRLTAPASCRQESWCKRLKVGRRTLSRCFAMVCISPT